MRSKKIFYWATFLSVSAFFSFTAFFLCYNLETEGPTAIYSRVNSLALEEKEASSPVSIALVGDIMMDRGIRDVVGIHGGEDYGYITQYLDFLNDADVVFGNLEGPISDGGLEMGGEYSFGMDPAVAGTLKDSGFSVLSVTNNHSGDRGEEGFSNTLDNLDSVGIFYTGGGRDLKKALEPVKVKTGETVIGFLGFSDLGPTWLEAGENKGGVLVAGSEYHDRSIRDASKEVDVLVVSYHFGEEYMKDPTKRQRRLAYRAVDLGADVVAGHHPHVTQPVEEYKGGIIAYSLGNFIFDQYFSKETMEGLVLLVEIEGENISFSKKKVQLTDHFQPRLAD
ncbi:MAG: CapA family protein [Patescibacteria group bacterium]